MGPGIVGAVPAPSLPDDEEGVLEIRDGVPVAAALSAEARAAGVTLRPGATLLASDPAAARSLVEATGSIPDDDRYGQLTRALWTDGMVLDVPAGVHLTQADPPALVERGGRPRRLRAHVHPPGRRRAAPRSSRNGCRAPSHAATDPQAFLAGTSEISLGTGRQPVAREHPGPGPADHRLPAPDRPDRPGRLAPVGPRPARVAARPIARRQPARGRPQLRRAGGDRLRRRRSSCST